MEDKKMLPEQEEAKQTPTELAMDELGQVVGAGNPFDKGPRVPEKPIDPELRGDA